MSMILPAIEPPSSCASMYGIAAEKSTLLKERYDSCVNRTYRHRGVEVAARAVLSDVDHAGHHHAVDHRQRGEAYLLELVEQVRPVSEVHDRHRAEQLDQNVADALVLTVPHGGVAGICV